MSTGEYLYVLCALFPFLVCFTWLMILAAGWKRSHEHKHVLALFALMCTLLYFCHSWFFTVESGGFTPTDALYVFCNLSVYPVFYFYILSLVGKTRHRWHIAAALIPALVISVLAAATSGAFAVLLIARILFAAEVIAVAVFGLIELARFDREIQNFYSDTEGKSLKSVSVLLVCVAVMSLLSSVANIVGREVFQYSIALVIPSAVFSAFLFAIFLVGNGINFDARDFRMEEKADAILAESAPEPTTLASLEVKISAAMEEKKLYLIPGIKITDVATAVGSNRTYVSSAINGAGGMSFADYVNSRRVEYAKKLLKDTTVDGESAMSEVATKSGFASFPSFYRAFMKFTGKSPSAWLKDPQG